jgi:hypothetical protein
VRILITSPDTFTGGTLTVGSYYNVEPACEGTSAQNKTLHKLIAIYFRSGLYSYRAKTEKELKDQIKLHIGLGVEYYVYVDTDGKKRKSKTLPENVMVYKGEEFIWKKLFSWRDYTKKQRMDLIDGVIKEMITAGVQTKEFYELLDQLEKNSAISAWNKRAYQ